MSDFQNGDVPPDCGVEAGRSDGVSHPAQGAAGRASAEPSHNKPAVISSLAEIPALGAYLRRIDAQPRSLFGAAVTEQVGRYRRDLATIRLNKDDGQITVNTVDGEAVVLFEPTDAERHAIAIEAKSAIWPEHFSPLGSPPYLPDFIRGADPENLFEFRNAQGELNMLQLRVEKSDGGKCYLPFTYWTDQVWRELEPEGLLPLWGMDQLKNQTTAFIHEGAKAARAAWRLTEAIRWRGRGTREEMAALAAHPWCNALSHAAQLGWIGGALNPNRTDWSVLQKAGVDHVFIVADNDAPGHAAVPKIARALAAYPITVEAVRFDGRFPSGFDLADPLPEGFFK